MFNASPGLNVACAAILTEMLKQLPRTKALALVGNAADALEKDRNQTDATIVKLLRGEWLKMI
jgi:hypothetical protein